MPFAAWSCASAVIAGQIYVAGGIAPRIITRIQAGEFMRSFRALGRLAEFAATVPVHVIMNADVGLLGAASAATEAPLLPSPPASRSPASMATGSR